MPAAVAIATQPSEKRLLTRALSLFSDVRPGEATTALLMMLNIFILLICYSVIKTVREPLILLGGGAEVRSYTAAGQALLLMGFVPLYSWFASRVDRAKLLVGVTLFFIVCIELFAIGRGRRACPTSAWPSSSGSASSTSRSWRSSGRSPTRRLQRRGPGSFGDSTIYKFAAPSSPRAPGRVRWSILRISPRPPTSSCPRSSAAATSLSRSLPEEPARARRSIAA